MLDAVVLQNKAAWEHRAYEWRVRHQGTPQAVAKEIIADPKRHLRYHADLFEAVAGKRIASVCGSDGRRAVALAALQAEATVFDLSAPQRDYAMALAEAAGVAIGYEIGDFCHVNLENYGDYFDYAYAEGGILHYFHDLDAFFSALYNVLKPDGVLVLCDFHPVGKILPANIRDDQSTDTVDYFDSTAQRGDVAYKQFFDDERDAFPDVMIRRYTLSEIINAAIRAGLRLQAFHEHPGWINKKRPGEFTVIAVKCGKVKP